MAADLLPGKKRFDALTLHAYLLSERLRVTGQIGSADWIAFHQRDAGSTRGRQRQSEQADAGIEIDDGARAGERGHSLDQWLQQIAVALKERPHVPLQRESRSTALEVVCDHRSSAKHRRLARISGLC